MINDRNIKARPARTCCLNAKLPSSKLLTREELLHLEEISREGQNFQRFLSSFTKFMCFQELERSSLREFMENQNAELEHVAPFLVSFELQVVPLCLYSIYLANFLDLNLYFTVDSTLTRTYQFIPKILATASFPTRSLY